MSAVLESVHCSTECVYPIRMNWREILSDLQAMGCTWYRVGVILGVSWSTLRRWRDGSEPGWAYGQALLELHAEVCGSDIAQLRRKNAHSVV